MTSYVDPTSPWAPRRTSTSATAAAEPPMPPLVDGRYEVLRPVSRGRLGDVYEARHRISRRAVVVKVGRSDAAHLEESKRRLLREARALGAMQHAAIPLIIDAGHCAQTGPFLVTEKLEGRSLEGVLAARGQLDLAGTVHVLRAIAGALAEVHARGFVHRDIKPANVFAAHLRPGLETVKLIDFGVVGVLGAPPAETITQLGAVLGTPGYMAPEQLADASAADARADLYSLGLLALECLGVRPDQGPERRRMQKVASTTLSNRADVPPGLVSLLDDLTCPDANKRPRDAEHVLARLDAVFGPARSALLMGYGTAAGAQEASAPAVAPAGAAAAMPVASPAAARTPEVDARRKQTRAPYVTPVRILHDRGVLDGRSEDVSTGGLLVLTQGDASTIHGATHVRFALPTAGKMVTLPVHVRWKREQPGRTAVGLEFYPLASEVREAIGTYVKWLCADK